LDFLPAPHLVTNECETMKNLTTVNKSFKKILSVICCFLFILTTANAHGKQSESKPEHAKNTAGKKVSSKTTDKKSCASRQNNKPSPIVSAKTTDKKSRDSQQKKKSRLKLSTKNTGKINKTKQTLSKKKSAQLITADITLEHQPSPFQYSPSDSSEEKLQEVMKEYIGIPYRSGGSSLRGMDCSGFARTIYANLFGIELPHNSAAQFSFHKLQRIDEDELQTGDLLFFSQKRRINHVGVYLGDGNFIHATNGHGITISSLDDQHWKSRMVGTKRPMSFDKTGMETLQFEGGFDIRLNTDNYIKSYARDEFRPAYDHASTGRPYAFRETNHEVYDFDNGHQYAYEVEYKHRLWNDYSFSVSAAREKLDKASAWNIYDREMDAVWPFYKQAGDDASSTVRHGFKLASEISPLEGLTIMPSFVYFNYDQPAQKKEMLEVPKRIFGLSTQIIPAAGPWSVSMAMHYADQMEMMDSLFKTSDLLNTIDMSLKLGYYFSRNLEFSIMGKHDFNPTSGRTDLSTSAESSSINSDFIFKLDMKY
jgi:cell wall-associated NlpC family hydrolase